jgi:tetratricopeptide (TPR) repeat protein
VDVCLAGLSLHPTYLSARVTLGRALIELGQLDEAHTQLETVLRGASENLAAIRGLAEIHHRRGDLDKALTQYRAALLLARNDPDLEQTVADLSRQVAPQARIEPEDGLSFEQITRELRAHAPAPPPLPARAAAAPVVRVAADLAPPPPATSASAGGHERAAVTAATSPAESAAPVGARSRVVGHNEREEAAPALAALHQWLTAIHVTRADRHA